MYGAPRTRKQGTVMTSTEIAEATQPPIGTRRLRPRKYLYLDDDLLGSPWFAGAVLDIGYLVSALRTAQAQAVVP